jgi:hypothetical protein
MSGSNPGFVFGQVPTPAQWNGYFSGKFDEPVIVVPPQAVAAGFTNQVFFDDFTTSNTIATTQNAASGFNWYWGNQQGVPTQCWSVNTSQTAAGLSNGNSGGGANASPNGGILTLTGPGNSNDAIITVPGSALNNGTARLPTSGCWLYGYFEAYLQCNPANVVPPTASGWPAFWTWSAEGLVSYGFGSSNLNATSTEVDIIEVFATQFSDPAGTQSSAIHQPGGSTTVYSNQAGVLTGAVTACPLDNANWHTYGMLWYPGGVSFFVDNVQVGPTAAGPFSTSALQMETAKQHLFMLLGTGIQSGGQLNVDWVRVLK